MFRVFTLLAALALGATTANASTVEIRYEGSVNFIDPSFTPVGTLGVGTGFTARVEVNENQTGFRSELGNIDPSVSLQFALESFEITFESGQSESLQDPPIFTTGPFFLDQPPGRGAVIIQNDRIIPSGPVFDIFDASIISPLGVFTELRLIDPDGIAFSSLSLSEAISVIETDAARALPVGELFVLMGVGDSAFGRCDFDFGCTFGGQITFVSVTRVTPVPLPLTAPLLLAGLGGLLLLRDQPRPSKAMAG